MPSVDSMGWMAFASKMSAAASQLNDSNLPMVLGLPDGKEVRFDDIEVYIDCYHDTPIAYVVKLKGGAK